MNREESTDGSQSEEVEIEKEGQEGGSKKEGRREALRTEETILRKEKENSGEESAGEKEICYEESSSEEARSVRATRGRACPDAEPDHLSPVQPAGGRRQSG
jgi:hypothetical protein